MFKVPEENRLKSGKFASDASFGNNGIFIIPFLSGSLSCIASNGGGWEHVSIRFSTGDKDFTPSWDMMCFVKDKFWGEEDVVMQLHPAKADYVNVHENVLHLWRPIGKIIPTPPKSFV